MSQRIVAPAERCDEVWELLFFFAWEAICTPTRPRLAAAGSRATSYARSSTRPPVSSATPTRAGKGNQRSRTMTLRRSCGPQRMPESSATATGN